MADGSERVAWSGRRAVVTFPEHVGAADAAWVSNQLLGAVRQGAVTLIVDMSATVRCDQAVADAVGRAYLRAAADKTGLRLVICAPDVRRLISDQGLDRLVPMYMSLEAALADGIPDGSGAGGLRRPPGPAPWSPAQPEPGRRDGPGPAQQVDAAVLGQLVDALDDGIALTGEDGTIVLANRKLAAMFGYPAADLAGQPVEVLVPAGLREAHHRHLAAYQRRPSARPMADRARLAGMRSDGTTVPVTITLAPVPTADGQLTLAVVRNAAHAQERDDLVMLLSGAAAREAEHTRELLDRVVASMFHAGICLQGAATLPAEAARARIGEALQRLDDTIHEIRHHILRSGPPGTAP
jgi:PAS domain S-box-containing protein